MLKQVQEVLKNYHITSYENKENEEVTLTNYHVDDELKGRWLMLGEKMLFRIAVEGQRIIFQFEDNDGTNYDYAVHSIEKMERIIYRLLVLQREVKEIDNMLEEDEIHSLS